MDNHSKDNHKRKTVLKRASSILLSLMLCISITAAAVPAYAAGPGGGSAPGEGGSSGGGSSSSNITWSGATEITSATTTTGKTYSSTTASENAVLVDTSDDVTLTNATVTKSGGTSADDDESFYGINSAIMCKGGGTTTITGANITTDAAGANGVFSYGGNVSTNATSGDGTTVVISDSTITTSGNGSGGIMTTGQGITKASNLTVSTSGDSSAAIRSDRGGGTVTVDGGTYETSGTGSPAIYATATITVSNAELTTTGSQGVVNEGGNTVILNDCTVNAGNASLGSQDYFRNGIFLYQSMSGDASDGASVFTMTGGTLNNTYGHVFHVTNTSAAITLEGVDINNTDSEGVLLSVCDDAWSGLDNVATVNATDQILEGTILVGSDSTANINLSGSSVWTGSFSGSITAHKNSSTVSSSLGTVNVTLSDDALWVLDEDCTVSSISGSGSINYNGHTLTVDGTEYTSGSPGVSTITESTATAADNTDNTETGDTSSDSTETTDTTSDNTDNTDTTTDTTASDADDDSEEASVVKGETYVVNKQYYKVTKVATDSTVGTVTFVKAKNAKTVSVPKTVKLADGKTYKVTVIGAKAFTASKIRKVIIGANVAKISKNAFAGSKATKVIVKTKKLTKAKVKNCLKSSKVKVVQVKVGTAKVNKKYVTKYKKIFTKKITGKAVTVK